MLRVIGKWSLSGMAIASTQASVPKIDFKPLYFWEYSTKIREAVSIPLAYLGGVTSADNVSQCMEAGFEAVQLARALLREPDLVNRWREVANHYVITVIAALPTSITRRVHGVSTNPQTSLRIIRFWPHKVRPR